MNKQVYQGSQHEYCEQYTKSLQYTKVNIYQKWTIQNAIKKTILFTIASKIFGNKLGITLTSASLYSDYKTLLKLKI